MPPGRPPLAAKNVYLHVRVTPATYDRLWAKAQHAGVSVPELLRRALEKPSEPLSAGASSAHNPGHAARGRAPDGQSR